jgi:peptide deformylase
VIVEFQDVTGALQRLSLDGLQARIFQHEFDHLQGVLFQDRMTPEVLATIADELASLERDWEATAAKPVQQQRGAQQRKR